MLNPSIKYPDRSWVTTSLVSSLIFFSTLFISLRIYARFILIKQPGLDDALAIAAYVRPPNPKKHVDIVSDG